jgi:rod shape-determining protein MreC
MIAVLQRYWRTGALVLVAAGILALALGGYLAPALTVASAPLIAAQRWVATRYLAVYELVRSPQDSASLREENVRLEQENSVLQSQVIELQEQLKDTNVLEALLQFARSRPNDSYIAAAVIMRDPSPFLRYVIIDQGSDSGLRHGMPVVTAQGLVGRVDAVVANAARVQLITDPGSGVNVRLSKSGVEAIITGSITGDVSMEMIPQDAQLQTGDVILTSGLGGNYPSNILVGQVANVRRLETELFQTAAVQPAVDFTNLRAVLVVTSFTPVDIGPLIPAEIAP